MKPFEKARKAIKAAHYAWLFLIHKDGAEELAPQENPLESSEFQDLETALEFLEPLTWHDSFQVFNELEAHVSAGQQAFEGMCEFLEWHMATYEYIKDLKKTAKHEVERHEGMIEKGLLKVRVLAPHYEVPRTCVRVREKVFKEG